MIVCTSMVFDGVDVIDGESMWMRAMVKACGCGLKQHKWRCFGCRHDLGYGQWTTLRMVMVMVAMMMAVCEA